MHMSSVLKQSGTNAKKRGSIPTASSHISCVFSCPGISRSNVEHFHKTYLLIPLGLGKGQILWTEKMIQDPSINVFNDSYLCMRRMPRTATEDKP